MTDDLATLPMHHPDESPAVANGAKGARPCARHSWELHVVDEDNGTAEHRMVTACARCGKLANPESRRRGRTSRTRGNAKERAWCHRLDLNHTGQFGGKADGENALFIGQCKSRQTGAFPSWMSDELDKLAALRTGRTPILGVIEAPGVGRRERRLVVVDEADWIALHVGDGAA